MQEDEYEAKMIEAFVGKEDKTQWYANAFAQYNVNGVDALKWHWSWWAFGGGFGFLLYRKAYIASLVVFFLGLILGFIPFVGIALMILTGGYSTYFVYKTYKEKKAEIELNITDDEKRIETMQNIGGYHQWVIWVYAAFMTIIFLGIVSAILLPALATS